MKTAFFFFGVCHVRTVKTPAKTGFVCARRRMESRASAFDGGSQSESVREVPHQQGAFTVVPNACGVRICVRCHLAGSTIRID